MSVSSTGNSKFKSYCQFDDLIDDLIYWPQRKPNEDQKNKKRYLGTWNMKCWNNKKQIIVNRKIINNNNNQLLLSTFVSFYGWHVPCSAHLALFWTYIVLNTVDVDSWTDLLSVTASNNWQDFWGFNRLMRCLKMWTDSRPRSTDRVRDSFKLTLFWTQLMLTVGLTCCQLQRVTTDRIFEVLTG